MTNPPTEPPTAENLAAADVAATVAELAARWEAARPYNIGFPGATDIDHTPLAPLLAGHLLNNVGDPWVDGVAANHTKALERQVVAFVAGLLRAPADDFWGYVTSGGTEGNLYGLRLARTLHPDAVVYHSAQAHPSIPKSVDLLGMTSVTVRADPYGEIDYRDLARQIDTRRHRPVVIAATIGSTMDEAVDDIRRITDLLDDHAVTRRFVHADAALSGIPLALLEPDARPGFDFADGADSITISGHKFLGTVTSSGVVVTRKSLRDRLSAAVAYTGSADTTISGSRNGHTPLMLWHTIGTLGVDGLRQRAAQSRELAMYLHRRLCTIGVPATRNPHASTVVFPTPPEQVTKKWVLATHGGRSHIITTPGTARTTLDEYVTDVQAALTGSPSPATDKPLTSIVDRKDRR